VGKPYWLACHTITNMPWPGKREKRKERKIEDRRRVLSVAIYSSPKEKHIFVPCLSLGSGRIIAEGGRGRRKRQGASTANRRELTNCEGDGVEPQSRRYRIHIPMFDDFMKGRKGKEGEGRGEGRRDMRT